MFQSDLNHLCNYMITKNKLKNLKAQKWKNINFLRVKWSDQDATMKWPFNYTKGTFDKGITLIMFHVHKSTNFNTIIMLRSTMKIIQYKTVFLDLIYVMLYLVPMIEN